MLNEVDLEAEGRHIGFLRAPHSSHRSAYGWIPIPFASIKRGDGPAVLVMAGNHGDEYEGQVIVSQLMREVTAEMISGQLMLMPMANFPAAEAYTRTSPIDGLNLNRCFPGRANGTMTECIAHYIESTLLPRCKLLVDLHSGGSSLVYDGATMLALEPRDAAERDHLFSMLKAFGLPMAFLQRPNSSTISSAARRQGAMCIVTELGGGGRLRSDLIAEARQGLLHLLAALGVLRGDLVPGSPPASTRYFRIDPTKHYVYANVDGLFEPLAGLGQEVHPGDPAARIHTPKSPERAPHVINFSARARVICMRATADTRRGDCLYQLASLVPADAAH